MNVKRDEFEQSRIPPEISSIFSSVQDNKFDISIWNSFILRAILFFFSFTPLSLVLKFFSSTSIDAPPNNFFPPSCRRNILEEFNAPREGGGGGETSRWIFTRSGIHGIRLPISKQVFLSLRFEFCELRIHNYETRKANPFYLLKNFHFLLKNLFLTRRKISFFCDHR